MIKGFAGYSAKPFSFWIFFGYNVVMGIYSILAGSQRFSAQSASPPQVKQ
jgi:hypothetical protein